MYWLKMIHVMKMQKYFRILIRATIWCQDILIYYGFYQLDKTTTKTTSSYIVVIKIISIYFLDWKKKTFDLFGDSRVISFIGFFSQVAWAGIPIF